MGTQQLKSYLYDTIIPQGFDMVECIDFEEHHLDKLIAFCQEAKKDLANNCHVVTLQDLLEDLINIKDSSFLCWDSKYTACLRVRDKVYDVSGWYYGHENAYQQRLWVCEFYDNFKEYMRSLND